MDPTVATTAEEIVDQAAPLGVPEEEQEPAKVLLGDSQNDDRPQVELMDPILGKPEQLIEDPHTGTQKDSEPSIRLLDLVDALHTEQIQAERSQGLEVQLRSLFLGCGTNGRLLPVQCHLYRQMAHSFRMDEKAAFVALHSQLTNLRQNCEFGSNSSYPASRLTMSSPHGPKLDASWIRRLPSTAQPSLLTFLSNLRRDTSSLTSRISKLSSSQLFNLARPHKQPSVLESFLSSGGSVLGRLDLKAKGRGVAKTYKGQVPMEQLVQDPLLLLLHGLFNTSNPSGLNEENRRLHVWSSVCARVIEDGRAGWDDFCLAVFDLFPLSGGSPIHPGIENFLMSFIRTGERHLGSQAGQLGDPSVSKNQSGPSIQAASDEVFDQALESLLDLLLEVHHSATESHLGLVRATMEKIGNPEKKSKARSFAVSRWFCTSFLAPVLVIPEVCFGPFRVPHLGQKLISCDSSPMVSF